MISRQPADRCGSATLATCRVVTLIALDNAASNAKTITTGNTLRAAVARRQNRPWPGGRAGRETGGRIGGGSAADGAGEEGLTAVSLGDDDVEDDRDGGEHDREGGQAAVVGGVLTEELVGGHRSGPLGR